MGSSERGVGRGGVLLAWTWNRAFGSPRALSGPIKIINFSRLALERQTREHIPVIYNLAVLPLNAAIRTQLITL